MIRSLMTVAAGAIVTIIVACSAPSSTTSDGSVWDSEQPLWPSSEYAALQSDGHDAYGAFRYVETFDAGGMPVHAYAYDEIVGPFGRVLVFWVMEPGGPYAISLGSYDYQTELAHELGETGPDEHFYHLDLYKGRMHGTLGFFLVPPSYQELKSFVIDYVAKRSAT